MKIIKWVLLIVLVLLVLLVAGVGIAIATLDPNEYKSEITEQVMKQTGRTLSIEGDMDWSVFPWLGLSMGKTSFGNAEGFGEQAFAEFEAIDAHVELLPLLKKQIKISTITLKGLNVNLTRKADGQDNWSDLAKSTEETDTAKPEESAEIPDFSLAVEGVEVIDASLVYDDQQGKTRVNVSPLNIKTGKLEPGKPMPAEIDFKMVMDQLAMVAGLKGDFTIDPKQNLYHVESDLDADVTMKQEKQTLKTTAKGRLVADPMQGQFQLGNVTINTNLTGEGLPPAGIDTQLRAEIKADTEKQTISVDQLTLTLADLVLKGRVAVEQFIDGAKYSGQLNSEAFSPKAVMKTFGMAAPETAKADALQSAKMTVTLNGDTRQLQLKPISVNLDESTLTGEFAIKDFSTTALRYDLTIDKLNADHYLPKSTSGGGSADAADKEQPAAPASDAIELPVDMLKGLNLAGTAKINEFIFNQLVFTNASMTTSAKNGVLNVKPLSANAYQGKAVINAALDVNQKQPLYKTDVKLNGVRSEKILTTLFGEPYISGAADFTADLTTSGKAVSSLKKNLNGRFNAQFHDGSIKGSKLSAKLTEAKNGLRKIQGKPPLDTPLTGETKFSVMKASGVVKNGVVTNQDLEVVTPVAYVKGDGSANLPAETVNYTIYLTDEQKDREQSFLPVKISGPFANLKYDIKLDALAKQRMKQELEVEKQKAKEKLKQELAEKTEKKKEELKEKLGDQLGDDLGNKLKDLFK